MSKLLHTIETAFKKATFGMGCFWANDALFGATRGVLRTRVGYSGGRSSDPTYKSIGDHTEVIEIDYDPTTITYDQLLQLFWDNHEYGLTNRVKRQYMSLILYHDEDQKKTAESSMQKKAAVTKEPLITELASAGAFYPAEDYHQKYRLQRHKWVCEDIGLTPELLQTSHVACRLNGYVAGVGKRDDVEKDVKTLGLSEKVAKFVLNEHEANKGGTLYC